MGKYMRKAKMTSDVAVMELSQSSFNVHTRAKTLALTSSHAPNPPDDSSISYLQLRNRRVEKPNLAGKQQKCHLGASKEAEDFGVEASFGENNLEFDGRERSTSESTPCSLKRGSETIWTPPGSSTRPTGLTISNQQIWNSMRDMPTTHEMEEFFAFAEQEQRRLFTEKYNFDVVNDIPLPGRYEWVRVCTP